MCKCVQNCLLGGEAAAGVSAASVHWMWPSLDVDSIRLAVFIISPCSVYMAVRLIGYRPNVEVCRKRCSQSHKYSTGFLSGWVHAQAVKLRGPFGALFPIILGPHMRSRLPTTVAVTGPLARPTLIETVPSAGSVPLARSPALSRTSGHLPPSTHGRSG